MHVRRRVVDEALLDALRTDAAGVHQLGGLVDDVERDRLGGQDGILAVVDDERMSGHRHRAYSVVVRAVADDLFLLVVDVDVADRVSGLAVVSVALNGVGDDRDVVGRERRHADRLGRRRRTDLAGRRNRRRRAAAAHQENRSVALIGIRRRRRNRRRRGRRATLRPGRRDERLCKARGRGERRRGVRRGRRGSERARRRRRLLRRHELRDERRCIVRRRGGRGIELRRRRHGARYDRVCAVRCTRRRSARIVVQERERLLSVFAGSRRRLRHDDAAHERKKRRDRDGAATPIRSQQHEVSGLPARARRYP